MSGMATAIWHDVECGSYAADLPLWEELAERQGGPVLELGCGTGRVALHLARRGHRVIGVDRDPDLILTLAERASDLPVEPICTNVLDLELRKVAALALAPMQFLQLLRGVDSRTRCLRRVGRALRPGGLLAAAIVYGPPADTGTLPPLPDVREVDGWIYSSLPLPTFLINDEIILRRLRQTVSPTGTLSDEENEVTLAYLLAEDLEYEAEMSGFRPVGHRQVPPTAIHEGSLVVLLEKRT